MAVLEGIDHPNVLQFYDWFESRWAFFDDYPCCTFHCVWQDELQFMRWQLLANGKFVTQGKVLSGLWAVSGDDWNDPIYATKFDIWLSMDGRATGGELFDRLFERGKFTERDAITMIRSVLKGLEYLHARNVVHRGTCCSLYAICIMLITFSVFLSFFLLYHVCRSQARKPTFQEPWFWCWTRHMRFWVMWNIVWWATPLLTKSPLSPPIHPCSWIS